MTDLCIPSQDASRRRRIGVVTVARSDFGIYLPLLRLLRDCEWAELQLMVAAAHLSSSHGRTVDWIREEQIPIAAEVPMTIDDDSPAATAFSMATGLRGFAEAFDRLQPDMVVLLGDRFEMHSAACAAVPFQIPIAHIHGGEVTTGAIDDALRHSISKLSHLHFASTETYARRLVCMGAPPQSVVVSGAPGLDSVAKTELLSSHQLADRLGMEFDQPPLAVTFHPETRSTTPAANQVAPLLEVLAGQDCPLVISRPNADPGNVEILRMWEQFCEQYRGPILLANNLGSQNYFSLLSVAGAMIGNSSSGIIEAASFRLPVVNIGARQGGRVRPDNVIDTANRASTIAEALDRALSNEFRDSLRGLVNPYGDGRASERVFRRLKSQSLGPELLNLPFYDVDAPIPKLSEAA